MAARLSGELLDEAAELVAALLEVLELVEARAGRGEQDDVARRCAAAAAWRTARSSVPSSAYRPDPRVERGGEPRSAVSPMRWDRPNARRERRDELGEVLALGRPAEDEVERRVVGGDPAPRRGGVRRLGVVDVADAVELGDELEPVRDAGEGAQRLGDRVVADAGRARGAVAAAAFSRLCAPGMSGSAGSGSLASNSMRPGIALRPRGTIAVVRRLF